MDVETNGDAFRPCRAGCGDDVRAPRTICYGCGTAEYRQRMADEVLARVFPDLSAIIVAELDAGDLSALIAAGYIRRHAETYVWTKLGKDRGAPKVERLAWLRLDGWCGRWDEPVIVVGETSTRYRIRCDVRIRLAGRGRHLSPGATTLVPRRVVRFGRETHQAAAVSRG